MSGMAFFLLLSSSQTLASFMYILQFASNVIQKSCERYKTGLVVGLISRHTALVHAQMYTKLAAA